MGRLLLALLPCAADTWLLDQVLVGRNNKQNDELTNKVAKTGDVWMHARGCPGAHVLLRASTSNRSALRPDYASTDASLSAEVRLLIVNRCEIAAGLCCNLSSFAQAA